MNRSIFRHTAVEPANDLQVPSLLKRIYAIRGVYSNNELNLEDFSLLSPPDKLLNIEQAVDLLYIALRERWRILIMGDFDVDGATSCTLAVRALRAMGAYWVSYCVPNRFRHGYGLTPEIVEVAAEKKPDLIVTVDNGISSHEGVKAAQARGIKVLITDHHSPGQNLPDAEVIINPNQQGDNFPSKNLAGVGVIFYVMMALRKRLREVSWFTQSNLVEPNLAQFLDLVAVGTVADVVKLDYLNRILVKKGLERIRKKKCVPGITALCKVTKKSQDWLSAGDIGYKIGPCLNAAGRLEDIGPAIECLLTDDQHTAMKHAHYLFEINQQRRDKTDEIEAQALTCVDQLSLNELDLPFSLCLFDPSWHQGIIGIIAGRLKERFNRPVIVFAKDGDNMIKGSGRSVAKMNLRDVLAKISAQNPSLINRFGGHAMAGGMTLLPEYFDVFRQAFDTETRCWLNSDDLQGKLLSDGELTPAEFNVETAKLLEDNGPWGQGFPEPLFDGIFEVIGYKEFGCKEARNQTLQLQLRPPGINLTLKAVAFKTGKDVLQGKTSIRIAYHLNINRWNGKETLQLRVEHLDII